MRFFEPRSSPPPHCGGLQLALRSFASSAVGEQPPSEAYNPQRNTNNNKKSTRFVARFDYLYYFWGKRSVEKT